MDHTDVTAWILPQTCLSSTSELGRAQVPLPFAYASAAAAEFAGLFAQPERQCTGIQEV